MGLFNSGNQANAKIVVDADISGAETTLNRLVNLLGVVRRTTDIPTLNRLGSDLHYLNSSLNSFAIASTAGFAAFTAGGMKAADTMKVFKAQMTGITGSQAKANEMLKQTIALSNQLKIPLTSVMGTAGTLAASLKLSGQDISRLQEAFNIATRLAVRNSGPGGGTEGAAYAISEAYAGQYRSLATRFNITQDVFRSALKETGDPLKALDKVLNDIGITTEVAIEANKTFANSFKRLGDSVGLIANSALTPFLEEVLIPLVDNVANLAIELQENYPHLTRFATGFVLVGLAIIPAVRGLTEMIKLMVELKKLSLSSEIGGGILNLFNPNMWKGFDGGIAGLTKRNSPVQVGMDAAGPIMGTRQTGGLTSPTGFGMLSVAALGAVIGGAIAANIGPEKNKIFKIGGEDSPIWGQSVRGASADELFARFIDFLVKLVALMPQVLAVFGDVISTVKLVLIQSLQGWGMLLQALGSKIKNIPGLGDVGKGMEGVGGDLQTKASEMAALEAKRQAQLHEEANAWTMAIAGVEKGGVAAEDFADALNTATDKFGGAQLEIYNEMQERLKEAQDQYEEDVARENMDFWDKQAEASADYQRRIRESQEDFDRDEEQREQDLQDKIKNIQDDEGREITKRTTEYHNRISEMVEAFQNDQELKLQQHQLEMKRMQEDHAYALEVAAAHLDATAIIDENYNYNLKRRRAEEDFNLQQGQAQAQLDARLALEEEHFKQSIEELKINNEEKIEEMKANAKREKAQRKADFDDKMKDMEAQHTVEMNRMALDHQDKLNQLDSQHQEEMTKIQTQGAEKIAESLGIQRQMMENNIATVKEWWNRVGKILAGAEDEGGSTPKPPGIPHDDDDGPGGKGGYAAGGPVRMSGWYKLEKGEEVLNPGTASFYRGASGRVTPQSLAGRRGGGMAQVNFNLPNVTDYRTFNDHMPQIRQAVIGIMKEAYS